MSTQSARSEIKAAIYAKLVPSGTLDATLAALGATGVFDFRNVPQNQSFDYITLGDITETPENAFARRGYMLSVLIHIWSRALGTKNADAMLARLNTLLDQQPLTLATQTHVYTMYDWSRSMADPDGLTLHTIVRYRTFSQE